MSKYPPSGPWSGKNPPPYYATTQWSRPPQYSPQPPPYSPVNTHHPNPSTYPYYVQGTVMIPVHMGSHIHSATNNPTPSTYVTNYVYNGESSIGQPAGNVVQPVETSGDFNWIPTTDTTFHSLTGKAVIGGHEGVDLSPIWVIRSWHCGDLIPGKLSVKYRKASVAYGGKEIPVQNIEVLCARPESVRWVPASNGNVPPGAIVGGYTSTAETLYVGRGGKRLSGISKNPPPGKVHPSHKCCYIGLAGKEVSHTMYDVLTRI